MIINNNTSTVTNTSRRKRYWKINMFLFHMLKLNPFRDKNIWIFGAWEGKKYDDNTMYFFEYINKYHDEIYSVWMSNYQDIVNEVKSRGYRAVISDSKEGRRLQLKAGKVFYTNGIDDISNINFTYGAKFINMFHGFPIKKIYYSQIIPYTKRYYKQRIKDLLFCWIYQDFCIASSELCRKIYAEAFHIQYEKILITGFPRNDILQKKLLPSKIFTRIPDADRYRYIVYLPTYRQDDDSAILDCVKELIESEELRNTLQKFKYKFIFKFHFLTTIQLENIPENFCVLSPDEHVSTQELLTIADALVTDYSSCIIDYALKAKPSIIYSPDFKSYYNKEGIYEEWKDIYNEFSLKAPNELIKKLISIIEGLEDNLETTNKILEMCYKKDIVDKFSCENLWNNMKY